MEPSPTRFQPAPPALVRFALATCCMVVASAAFAAELMLEVIDLQHRLVRDMIPLLQPLLAPGGTLTGTSNQLIVRSTRENLAEIKDVVASVDTRVKQLKITVTQDLSAVQDFAHDGLSGELAAGDFGVSVPSTEPGNITLGIDWEQGGARYHTTRTRSQEDSNTVHFVTTIEGQPAYIATGQVLPYSYENATATPYGVQVDRGVTYAQASSGVYVTPQVQGDRVILDVAPQLERVDPHGSGAIGTYATTTTVSGRLGEWIALSGATSGAGGSTSELLARTRRQGDNSYTVWVKVEEQQ
ncbi:MAG: hypothetical protein EXR86_00340 [Gammaproteobacteria bacterium]|nr:hypothetical protein [Gammaproteobacteria bacterium]